MRDEKGRFIKGHKMIEHENIKKNWFKKGERASLETEFKKGEHRFPAGEFTSESTAGEKNPFYGKTHSTETREVISERGRGRIPWNFGKHVPQMMGENNPNWKGGIAGDKRHARIQASRTVEYKTWRRGVFQRDNYTCQECGQRGVELHADHIKPYAYFEELRYELSNGRTLCVDCHRLTDTWANGAKKLIREGAYGVLN